MEAEEKKEFVCSRCGACCRNIHLYEPASYLDRGDGVCKYYNDNDKSCTIYEFRPEICRVDKMYKLFKNKMTWNEYIDLSYESCEELRKLEKTKGVQPKEEKKEEIIKEEVKATNKNDWYDNKIVIENKEEEDYLFDDDEDFFDNN
jgi:hypothetical protein